jgi:hypothetical protein
MDVCVIGAGLFGVVERQAEWLAGVLDGRIALPVSAEMWRAIDAGGEPRSRRQFGATGPHTLLCNRHAYLRTLSRELRAATKGDLSDVYDRSHSQHHFAQPRHVAGAAPGSHPPQP